MTGAAPQAGAVRGAWPAGWTLTARAFRAAVECGRLDLPLPGSGRTWERWMAFADLAEEELSLARLAEGHADAVAILAELGGPPPPPGSLWGVWAANPPGPSLEAARTSAGWRLRGTKQYCSGARTCTHAVVTAAAPDGARLFAVSTEALSPRPGTWPAVGMAASDTLDVGFSDVRGGAPRSPRGIHQPPRLQSRRSRGRRVLVRGRPRRRPHLAGRRGETGRRAACAGPPGRGGHCAGDRPDSSPPGRGRDRHRSGRPEQSRPRPGAAGAGHESSRPPPMFLGRVGRALGAGPLCHDETHSRTVADLTVYLRQHHAERDLAALGALVVERGPNGDGAGQQPHRRTWHC